MKHSTRIKPIRVLVADPDQTLLATYGNVLTDHGWQLSMAGTGLQCMTQLKRFEPDVLVLEPEILWGSGSDLLAWMHAEVSVPTVPVIILTLAKDVDELCRVLAFPLEEFVLKPCSPHQLAKKIRCTLDGVWQDSNN